MGMLMTKPVPEWTTSQLIEALIERTMVKTYVLQVSPQTCTIIEERIQDVKAELNSRIPSMKEAMEGHAFVQEK